MRTRPLAAALLLVAAAGAGWVAATPVTASRDGVATGPGGAEGWTIVVLDAATGTSAGVFAGPGAGPAVVPGFGFTESYLAQLRVTQARPGSTLLSSVIGPALPCLLLAGALGALTVGLGALGTWSPVLGGAALAAGVAAAALRRDRASGATA